MPLTAEERVIPIRVKIKQAKKRLSELEEHTEKYKDSYASVAVGHGHLGFSQGPPELKRLPIIHFDMLAIAGDVLQNLRSVLDHVVHDLVLVANPSASQTMLRQVSFPIAKSAADYESLSRGKIAGMIEPRAMQFIDRLKPYKGGNELLWMLHDTNNIDKHRTLVSIGSETLCEGDGFSGRYLFKADNPSFATVEICISTLREMVEFVDKLVTDFSPLLEKV